MLRKKFFVLGLESVAADTTYGNGEFLQWLAESEHHSLHADA